MKDSLVIRTRPLADRSFHVDVVDAALGYITTASHLAHVVNFSGIELVVAPEPKKLKDPQTLPVGPLDGFVEHGVHLRGEGGGGLRKDIVEHTPISANGFNRQWINNLPRQSEGLGL